MRKIYLMFTVVFKINSVRSTPASMSIKRSSDSLLFRALMSLKGVSFRVFANMEVTLFSLTKIRIGVDKFRNEFANVQLD